MNIFAIKRATMAKPIKWIYRLTKPDPAAELNIYLKLMMQRSMMTGVNDGEMRGRHTVGLHEFY